MSCPPWNVEFTLSRRWARFSPRSQGRDDVRGAERSDGGYDQGRRKTEEKLSRLDEDIRSLLEPRSQADPKLQSAFAYTRMTAPAVRKALIDQKGYPVERCWGILEMHGNGTLLDTVEKALGWAKTMTWKGRQPVVQLMQRVYQTGVRLTKAALKPFAERVRRSKSLPDWSASIHPHPTRAVPLCSPP